MNIMVFDVPAESGGALSVLNDFYYEVLKNNNKNITWIFVLSTSSLEETENIKVLRFPWIKKSWGHRYFFDQIIAPKLVKQHKVDKIVSLQNVTVPKTNCDQTLYIHQPLPFVDYKFSFKENKLFWVYQNMIGRNIISSIKKAQHVIVQTEWMKKACVAKAQINSNKVEVIPPVVHFEIKKYFEPKGKSFSTFFYPASGIQYKNHQIIIDACKLLKSSMIDYEVIFTLNGNENEYVENLFRQVQKEMLPIKFEGMKTRKEVFDLYTKSVLLFPSYIETYGMPLLEAKLHKSIIFASNTVFSREILEGYENAYYFETFNTEDLCKLMYKYLHQEIEYQKEVGTELNVEKQNNELINLLI